MVDAKPLNYSGEVVRCLRAQIKTTLLEIGIPLNETVTPTPTPMDISFSSPAIVSLLEDDESDVDDSGIVAAKEEVDESMTGAAQQHRRADLEPGEEGGEGGSGNGSKSEETGQFGYHLMRARLCIAGTRPSGSV